MLPLPRCVAAQTRFYPDRIAPGHVHPRGAGQHRRADLFRPQEPRLIDRRRQGRRSTCLKSAITTYEGDVGAFPNGKPQGLRGRWSFSPDAGVDDWKGPYIKEIPVDPWKNPYVYKCPGARTAAFDIISFGPDKQEGTP